MRKVLWEFLLTCLSHPSLGKALKSDDFNIGFDLKFGYGIVAISYQNGSIFETARVESNEEYRKTFRRLSDLHNWHYAPPYYTPQERWSDYCRQLQRRARKAVGLPASSDVAAISTLIRGLKTAAETKLGVEITSAAVSVPHLPAIYDEDLYDSFEYIGMEYLQITGATFGGTFLTYESMAALAGHGLAVCPNVTNPDHCPYDALQDNYYIIDYTRQSLFAYWTHARSAYYIIEGAFFNLDLGSDAQDDNPDIEYYWEAVREILLEPLLENINNPPKNIILVGEALSVNNPRFQEAFHSVLEEYFRDQPIPEIIDKDAEWVQAKGVADLVRRRPYRPIPVKPEMNAVKQQDFRHNTGIKQEILAGEQPGL